ncbi:hypothetical protein [Gryllotalpicola ginsengisoli]|uniref:hypothetical protein n=1 Tax=Gryllotalpicola ginsengisoli TaxID=444608 RepID=UPI0003B5D1EE|nr:hypothetical protein [Gryllotalpicola ginsengisoli]
MTEHAIPAVTHEDGEQNSPLIRFFAARIPAALGALIVTVLVILLFLVWAWSLVATWSSHPGWGLPLFQVTVAALLVGTVAVFTRRTFAWVLPLIAAALWVLFSDLPLVPIAQVILQAVTVTLMAWTSVVALTAAAYAEKPRF